MKAFTVPPEAAGQRIDKVLSMLEPDWSRAFIQKLLEDGRVQTCGKTVSKSFKCKGDTEVDYHHTVEDIGIVLGQAFAEAIGEKRGISRYGSVLLPMDEALILASVDISGRAFLNYDVQIPNPSVGGMDTELVEEFFISFVRNSNITLHIKQLDGKNTHHIIEGIFKAVSRALAKAASIDETLGGEIPSTKGIL